MQIRANFPGLNGKQVLDVVLQLDFPECPPDSKTRIANFLSFALAMLCKNEEDVNGALTFLFLLLGSLVLDTSRTTSCSLKGFILTPCRMLIFC